MLATSHRQPLRVGGASPVLRVLSTVPNSLPYRPPRDRSSLTVGWNPTIFEQQVRSESTNAAFPQPQPSPHPQQVDPLYLFACHLEWERQEEPSAAWEILHAAQSDHCDTRAHARALLSSSRHLGGTGLAPALENSTRQKRQTAQELTMKAPYGIEITENCSDCTHRKSGFFCDSSPSTLQALSLVSHKSTLPAGAILFVEGQASRGMFVLCTGKVNLSTTSREGKILILKTAEAGEALGLSAAISGVSYEVTAETATPCQLNFVDRKNLLELLQSQPELGAHATQCLSRDFQSAYRDIRDLILTRSSAGKLARLLLLQSLPQDQAANEDRIHGSMTHEEMAQRIGSSRETVTRLLSDLKKKELIRLDGPTLIIRNRLALEALAV